MAINRCLKTLIAENPKKTRTFFTATTSLIPTSSYPPLFFPSLFHCLSPSHCSRFLSPLSKWTIPFQSLLFLSSPPWKLSQSATPLYLRGNAVVLQKVETFSLNLDLIRSGTRFPVKLSFGSFSGDPGAVLDRVESNGVVVGRDGSVGNFVNLPNLISLSRMFSGPLLGCYAFSCLSNRAKMITNEMYSSAFVGLAISGATDWLDGYMARKMKINSVVGSYLDPLADKVLIGCVALAMVQTDLLHPGLVGLIVLRDVALMGGAVYQRARSLGWEWKSWSDFFNLDGTCPQKVEPLFLSKVNTIFQLVLVAAALLQPEFGTLETQSWITYLSWLVASTVASTAAYGVQHMRKRTTLMTRKS